MRMWEARRPRLRSRLLAVLGGAILVTVLMASVASAQSPDPNDPRVGLTPGVDDAGVAQQGMSLTSHTNNADAFINPVFPGTLGEQILFANSDMAFQGNYAFMGSFNGFQIFDISNPSAPEQVTAFVCPGGQGDLSVYGNLLFMSVEENRAKKDCTLDACGGRGDTLPRCPHLRHQQHLGTGTGRPGADLSRLAHPHAGDGQERSPKRVHLRPGPAGVRPPTELAGCDGLPTSGGGPPIGDNPSRWRIEVIKVPLAAPAERCDR